MQTNTMCLDLSQLDGSEASVHSAQLALQSSLQQGFGEGVGGAQVAGSFGPFQRSVRISELLWGHCMKGKDIST